MLPSLALKSLSKWFFCKHLKKKHKTHKSLLVLFSCFPMNTSNYYHILGSQHIFCPILVSLSLSTTTSNLNLCLTYGHLKHWHNWQFSTLKKNGFLWLKLSSVLHLAINSWNYSSQLKLGYFLRSTFCFIPLGGAQRLLTVYCIRTTTISAERRAKIYKG